MLQAKDHRCLFSNGCTRNELFFAPRMTMSMSVDEDDLDMRQDTIDGVVCRGSVRLYSDFYESDIIVASPLALATKLSEDEEEGEPRSICGTLLLVLS